MLGVVGGGIVVLKLRLWGPAVGVKLVVAWLLEPADGVEIDIAANLAIGVLLLLGTKDC